MIKLHNYYNHSTLICFIYVAFIFPIEFYQYQLHLIIYNMLNIYKIFKGDNLTKFLRLN